MNLIDRGELMVWMTRMEFIWRDQYKQGVVYKDFPAMADCMQAVREYVSEMPSESSQEIITTITHLSDGIEEQTIDLSGMSAGDKATFVYKDGKWQKKRCEFCEHFPNVVDNTTHCKKGWTWYNPQYTSQGSVCKTDGANCPHWKTKEKRRIWECVKCGDDVYFSTNGSNCYVHLNSIKDHEAIPKPDSERLVEK